MPPLPAVVFQHYRQPQHQGALIRATEVVLEGRREDAELRLYLRVDADDKVRLGYTLKGDRSPIAALSLLATWAMGRELAEVEALTLEQLADHYELPDDLRPALVQALEALEAALAVRRGEPNPYADEGALVCHCLHVREKRIERTIRERKLNTVDEVRFWTRACSGCRSCRTDVEEILDRVKKL